MLLSRKRVVAIATLFIVLIIAGYITVTKANINPYKQIGDVVDTFNGVNVYFNGGVGHVAGRNLTADGYNLGLKYQCVEFVKRYYYQHFQHKMPDSYGHAKSFFDTTITSGALNPKRGLLQFSNGTVKPSVDDIIVFDSTLTNRYGHVAIISKVTANSIEIIQQNPGPFGKSRETIALVENKGSWTIAQKNTLGFLRKP